MYTFTTMIRDGKEPTYRFAEIKYGKIVAINEHWVKLEEYRNFFEPNALFIDITGVTIDGECPQVGDIVTNGVDGYEIKHIKSVFSLAELKAYTIEKMKLIRDQKELEPIVYKVGRKNYTFDADKNAITRMDKARQFLEDSETETIEWTTFDNQRVMLKVEDFKGINMALAVRSNELHIKYNEIKETVNNTEDIEVLNNFTWEE